MLNVCPHCGVYDEQKRVEPGEPFARAICPHCEHAHPFRRLPLFVITGASGTGKTGLCLELAPQVDDCVFFESDVLWCPEFADPANDYRRYRNLSLRVAVNIAQAGRPVVLVGTAVPAQFGACPERRYVGEIHYLALICEQSELEARLRARPSWRGSCSPGSVERMVAFNRWLIEHTQDTVPPMTLLDTSHTSLQETARAVRSWLAERLPTYQSSSPAGLHLTGAGADGASAVEDESAMLRREAEAIIADLGLLRLLGRYGRAEVVGSVALDLVVKPDIDVHLLLPAPADLLAAADVLYHQLLSLPGVHEVRITDCRAEGGVKLGIDAYQGPSATWSLDLWLTDREEATAFADVERVRAALTPERRATILALKRRYHARGLCRNGLAMRIYAAVIEGGVRTEAEFERYLERANRGG